MKQAKSKDKERVVAWAYSTALRNALQRYMHLNGLNKGEMAAASGVSHDDIGRFLNGQVYEPKLSALVGYARGMRMFPHELMRELDRDANKLTHQYPGETSTHMPAVRIEDQDTTEVPAVKRV